MRQQYKVVCLLLLIFISEYQTQETTTPVYDWNGDPSICTVNAQTTPAPTPPPSLPKFTNQAEFRLERVIIRHTRNSTSPSELYFYHYVYDYDKNTLAVIENRNGTFDLEFNDYNLLRKSTYYYMGAACVATSVTTNNDMDGRSAVWSFETDSWHVRPLNELLLFSSNTPDGEVKPTYVGREVVRGIPVYTWRSCYINRQQFRTEQRVWSFAEPGTSMPSGIVGDFAVPVQAIVTTSIVGPDNIQLYESDEIFNVLSYQPSLTELAKYLLPPKGISCDGISGNQSVSLKDVGISWPFRFDVRIEVSTSRSPEWQRFHLFYHQGDGTSSGRLRYDYLPQGSEDYRSVIHDYTDNLTYTIDRQTGGCEITRGVDIPDVDPLIDPIRFFIKNETGFIFRPRENAWENKGTRPCLTDSTRCIILTTSINDFPPIVAPDTGRPTGETYRKTNMEYAWTRRAASPFSNASQPYDYPVSLYLKFYPKNNPSPFTETEDIEYEFYEMSHDRNLNQFDTSLCYRALNYEYLHLTFIFKLDQGSIIDSNQLNRGNLDSAVHYNLINRMQIRYSRVTDLEIDHESVSNDVMVFFTLLGRTPNPESESGFVDDEPTAEQARNIIQQIIDDGQFEFDMRITNASDVRFRAQPGSLKTSKQFMSSHTGGNKVVVDSYTVGSQAIAIIVGLFAGLFVGIIVAAVVRIVQKRPMPSLPSSISNPLPTINFHSKKTTTDTSEATSEATSDA